MSFALGKNMDGRVSNQINVLQNLLKAKVNGGFNAEVAAYYMNAKAPWVKLTSAVEFESGSRANDVRRFFGVDGNELAKQNVLFNLDPTQVNSDLPAGSVYSDYFGARPKPGITGVNIHTHNRFGSLRTANVNFICWDADQLATMELLYMRPGYSVILEFGHSLNVSTPPLRPYIDNPPPPGSITDEELQLRNRVNQNADETLLLETADVIAEVAEYTVLNTTEGIDFFGDASTLNSPEDVYKAISEKRVTNHFAYDGIYGIVKNFNWSLRPDGGYNCMTSIVSKGEMIESLKIDLSMPIKEWDGKWTPTQKLTLELSNETLRRQIVVGNPPKQADNTQASNNLTAQLKAAGITTAFDVNGTDKTFKIKGLVGANTEQLARLQLAVPKFVQDGSATEVAVSVVTEPGPSGRVYIAVRQYKWNK